MRNIIIEIGTYDSYDTKRLLNEYNNQVERIYTFEPHPFFYELSYRECFNFPKIEIINKAVCEENKKDVTFNECLSGGASSLLDFKDDEILKKEWGGRTDILASRKTFKVETTRIDTFLYNRDFKPENTNIIFAHIDAQGVDLQCLKSFGDFLKCVNKGCLETVKDLNKAIYKNQDDNTFEKIVNFLTENNFKIDSVNKNDVTNCEFNVNYSRLN